MTLYDWVLSPACHAVRLLIAMLGIDCEAVPVDVYPGRAHRRPGFLAIDPAGELPLLVDGDLRLHGAGAILLYLAARHDPARRWFPPEPATQACIAMWLAFAGRELAALAQARESRLFADAPPADHAGLVARSHDALERLDAHLGHASIDGRDWLAAAQPTIADLACYPWVALAHEGGIDRRPYHEVNRWLRRVQRLPGFETMPGIAAHG